MVKNIDIQKKKIIYLCSFIIGTIVATIIFNCMNDNSMMKAKIYSNYLMNTTNSGNIRYFNLFKYVIIIRLKEVFFLLIVGLTSISLIFESAYIFYLGFKNSLLICYLVLAKKNMAIIWYVLYIFPHSIIYILLIYEILLLNHKSNMNRTKGMNNKRYIFMQYFVIILLTFAECFIESYINPIIFIKISQYI